MQSMKTASTLPTTAVLERILDPLVRSLTPTASRALAAFRADPATQAHLAELADKCNEGQLTSQERAEYDAYVRAIDLVSILQSKAPRLLAKAKKR
jgi:hypothetical protein